MTRPLAVVAVAAALAAPSAAEAASLATSPAKPCYGSGETIHLIGADFTPASSVNLMRDGDFVTSLPTDSSGGFDATLKPLLERGTQERTYTAADGSDPGTTASVPLMVSVVKVRLSPLTGSVSRRFRISARGFTTGRTLWAHIVHRRSKRHIKIGRLEGACHNLRTRRRLLPRNVRLGRYRIQFDTFRRYRKTRPVQDFYTINVVRGGR
jgi:hypothetical protein